MRHAFPFFLKVQVHFRASNSIRRRRNRTRPHLDLRCKALLRLLDIETLHALLKIDGYDTFLRAPEKFLHQPYAGTQHQYAYSSFPQKHFSLSTQVLAHTMPPTEYTLILISLRIIRVFPKQIERFCIEKIVARSAVFSVRKSGLRVNTQILVVAVFVNHPNDARVCVQCPRVTDQPLSADQRFDLL